MNRNNRIARNTAMKLIWLIVLVVIIVIRIFISMKTDSKNCIVALNDIFDIEAYTVR